MNPLQDFVPATPMPEASSLAADETVASGGVCSAASAELSARFFKVLGDATRVRLLLLLLEAPATGRTVSELVEAVGLPQGRVSTHLGCLRWCGLVQTTRSGRYVSYRVTDSRVGELLAQSSAIIHDYAAGIASCGVIR